MATTQYIDIGVLGGVNLYRDQTAIADNEYAYAKNVFPVKPGILGVRPAMRYERTLYSDLTTIPASILGNSSEMNGLSGLGVSALPFVPIDFTFEPRTGGFVVVLLDPNTGTAYLDVVPRGADAPARQSLGELTTRPTLMTWQDDVYCFTGNDCGYRITDGVAPAPYAIKGVLFNGVNQDFFPRHATVRNRRAWFANFAGVQGGEQRIAFSEPNVPTLLTGSGISSIMASDSRWVAIPDSDEISAIQEVEVQAAGSPGQSAVFVWTRRATYHLIGEPLTDAEINASAITGIDLNGSLQVTKLNTVAGCVSAATVCQTPYGLLWAGEDDVWFMPYGSMPQRVGTKIRPVLLEQPAALRWKMHAVYDNGVYKLAMFAPGQGPTQFSPCGHQWWLDLRDGAPQGADAARWWGPMEYVPSSSDSQGTFCMRRDTNQLNDGRVWGITNWRNVDLGDAINVGFFANTAAFQGLSVVSFDQPHPRDTCAPQMQNRPWEAQKTYYEGDIITPASFQTTRAAKVYTAFICTTGDLPSDSTEPSWGTGSPVTESGGLVWTPVDYDIIKGFTTSFEPQHTQADNEIVPELRTKEFILGDGGLEKLIADAEMGYWSDQYIQMLMTRLTNDHDETTTTVLQPTVGFELDSAFDTEGNALSGLDATRLSRKWGSKLLPPTPGVRSVGNSFQAILTHTPGVYIHAGNDTLRFQLAPSYETYVDITIPNGWYEDMAAVVEAFHTLLSVGANDGVRSVLSGMTWHGSSAYNKGLIGITIWKPVVPGTVLCRLLGVDNINTRVLNMLGFRATGSTQVIFTQPASGYATNYATDGVFLKKNPLPQINSIKLRYKGYGRRPI